VLVAVGLLAMLVSACGVVKGTVTTIRELDRAGFTSAQIQVLETDSYQVSVRKDAEDLNAAAVDAARVVWERLPLRVERLEVTCNNGFGGSGRFAADREELEQRFGPRDPDLDRGLQESDFRTAGLVLVGLFVLGLVVLAGIIVLVLLLIRRSKRRKPPQGPPPGGWGPPPGGGGPLGPPPGYRPEP
jgi:hypothetical protein